MSTTIRHRVFLSVLAGNYTNGSYKWMHITRALPFQSWWCVYYAGKKVQVSIKEMIWASWFMTRKDHCAQLDSTKEYTAFHIQAQTLDWIFIAQQEPKHENILLRHRQPRFYRTFSICVRCHFSRMTILSDCKASETALTQQSGPFLKMQKASVISLAVRTWWDSNILVFLYKNFQIILVFLAWSNSESSKKITVGFYCILYQQPIVKS